MLAPSSTSVRARVCVFAPASASGSLLWRAWERPRVGRKLKRWPAPIQPPQQRVLEPRRQEDGVGDREPLRQVKAVTGLDCR